MSVLLAFLVATDSNADASFYFAPPDTALGANSGLEIVEYAGAVWIATGAGVNFTFDNGQTWLLYDSTNGLNSDNISAIFSQNNRLWLGGNHTEILDQIPYTISDGLIYTDDIGDNWIQYNFNTAGIDKIYGVDRYVYDITGHYDASQNENWIFFAGFAGALVGSKDGGNNWRRIFPTITDSINYTNNSLPQYRMLYFSCAIDTSHGDTLFLWGGTAEGVFQYIFIPNQVKLYTKIVNSIAFCDECTDSAGSYVFIGGNSGFARATKKGAPFISRFTGDGLPGNYITSVYDFRGRVFAGTANSAGTSSNGLAYSDDRGDSFTPDANFNSSYASGANSNMIRDFAQIGERLYMAAQEAGMFVSVDTGGNWTQILPDSSDITSANLRNVCWSLDAVGDTLRVGTDSGLVQLFLDPAGLIDSSRFYVFGDDASNGGRITKILTQRFFADSAMTILDSTAIWTVNQKITINGNPMVARSHDGGLNWDRLLIGQGVAELTRDIGIIGQDTIIFVGALSVDYISNYAPGANTFSYTIDDSTNTDDINSELVTIVQIDSDTLFFGTQNGIAISNDLGAGFKIHRVNTDSLKADAVIQLTRENSNPLYDGITGNFIQSMEIQERGSGPAIVWASCSPTTGGSVGIAAGAVVPFVDTSSTPPDTIFERLWVSVYDQFAWNFAFYGDTVFAATETGLVFTSDTGYSWDTMQFIDTAGNVLYDPTKPVYGVAAIDSFLWVGARDRILRVNLYNLESEGFFVVDTGAPVEEVYAFPVPYSNVQDNSNGITFRFALEADAYVTIEVYDFAMNLVRRVVDNQYYTAGYYPTATISANWDVLNGKGDQVAVGMYYFKVILSTGEERWGKLAVIP